MSLTSQLFLSTPYDYRNAGISALTKFCPLYQFDLLQFALQWLGTDFDLRSTSSISYYWTTHSLYVVHCPHAYFSYIHACSFSYIRDVTLHPAELGQDELGSRQNNRSYDNRVT